MAEEKRDLPAEVPQKRKRGRPKGSKNHVVIEKEIIENALHNWTTSSFAPAMKEDKAGLNRAAGWFVLQCWRLGQTVNHEDIDSMYNALTRYVELCTEAGMPMLVKTCHLALGFTGGKESTWRTGKYRSSDPRYREFVQVMDTIIAAGIESAGATGSLDKVLTIWFEKAHFGMYEQQGLKVEGADPLGERLTPQQIADKYSQVDLPD